MLVLIVLIWVLLMLWMLWSIVINILILSWSDLWWNQRRIRYRLILSKKHLNLWVLSLQCLIMHLTSCNTWYWCCVSLSGSFVCDYFRASLLIFLMLYMLSAIDKYDIVEISCIREHCDHHFFQYSFCDFSLLPHLKFHFFCIRR